MMIRPPYDDSLTMKVSIYTGKYIEIIISWGFKREKREKHSFFSIVGLLLDLVQNRGRSIKSGGSVLNQQSFGYNLMLAASPEHYFLLHFTQTPVANGVGSLTQKSGRIWTKLPYVTVHMGMLFYHFCVCL